MSKLFYYCLSYFCTFSLHLDTESLYTKVTQTILDETNTGRTYTWDVKSSIMGFQREVVAEKIIKIYDIPLSVDEYLDRAQELIELYMTNCRTMPGKK